MKRILITLAVCALMAVPAMANLSWNRNYADGDGTSLTSPYPGAIVDTFSGVRPGWTYTGNSIIYTLDQPGLASAPWSVLDGVKDDTPYLAVPQVTPNPYVTVGFGGGSYNYLGLHWGSMDAYNQIEFLSGASVVGTITGSDVWLGSPAGGQTIPETNAYVNIFSTLDFDSIKITSFGQPGYPGTSAPYAFELDNLAVAVIPAPGAILLGSIGVAFVGWLRRRRTL
jgi:hypothetical protein